MIRVLRLFLAIAALVIAGPSVAYLQTSVEPGFALNKDFGQEYLLARAVADGVNPYLPIRDLAERYLAPVGALDKTNPTPHPPTAGVLFLPVVLVDYVTAAEFWFVIQLVSLIVAVALLIRLNKLPVGLASAPIIAFVLLAWRPVLVDLASGQVTVVILMLLCATTFLLERNHHRSAGLVLGLSLLLKPIAWPWLLVLLWRRNWTAMLACAGVTLVGFALPGLFVGPGVLVDYATRVLPSLSAAYALEPTNISLWTVGPRLFGPTEAGRVLGGVLPLALLAVVFVWLRTRPPLGVALGVATCLIVLVNPISWQYSLVLLLLPGARLLTELRRRDVRRLAAISLLGLAALGLPMEFWPTQSVSTALAVALGVLLAYSSRLAPSGSMPARDDPAHGGVVTVAAQYPDGVWRIHA